MTKKITLSMIVLILLVTSLPITGEAAGAGFLRQGLREAGEYISRKLGREVVAEGGEALSRKTVKFFARHGAVGRKAFTLVGDDALKIAARYGEDGVRMLAAHSQSTARFLARHADEAVPIWKRFGRQGTELLAQHPGMAKTLLEKCGSRGITLSRKLSPKNLNRLAYFSKKVSRENLDEIITWSLAKGDEVLEFLWRHKGKIVTGVAVHSLFKTYENGFQVTDRDEDGNPTEIRTTPSFFGYIVDRIFSLISQTYPWFFPVAVTLLFVWLLSLLTGLKKPLLFIRRIVLSVYQFVMKTCACIRLSRDQIRSQPTKDKIL